MKKILILFSVFMSCLSAYSQTISPSPTTVNSGATVTITGVSESTSSSFWYAENASSYSIAAPYSSGNFGYATATIGALTNANFYNTSTKKATSFPIVVTNTSGHTLKVTFIITMGLYNHDTGTDLGPTTLYFTVTINSAPVVYYNDAQTGPWVKNNCGTGYVGSTVAYTVPANTYSASTKSAANQLALNAGQAYANANGVCQLPIYARVEYSNIQQSTANTTDPNTGSANGYITQYTADVKVAIYSNSACTVVYTGASPVTINMLTTINNPSTPGIPGGQNPQINGSYTVNNGVLDFGQTAIGTNTTINDSTYDFQYSFSLINSSNYTSEPSVGYQAY